MANKKTVINTVPVIDTIINGDSITYMASLPDNCVDLIIADPPYNLSKGGDWKWDNSIALNGMGGNWNKVMESWDNFTLETYYQFTFAWLAVMVLWKLNVEFSFAKSIISNGLLYKSTHCC